MFGLDIGIDLGTTSVIIYIKGRGIVLSEPSIVATDAETEHIIAAGSNALKMLGRTPDSIKIWRPLKDGIISDYTITEQMLKYFLKTVCGNSIFKPKVIVCMPSSITEVQKRTIIDVLTGAGARKACLIEEPLAAAIGAGMDISLPKGSMVVDIGGGTTDIAVITLGGMAVSSSVKMAGKKFDDAIIRYIRKTYNMLIGEVTAEQIKKTIGCAYKRESDLVMVAKGRDYATGLPRKIAISSSQTMEALDESINQILDEMQKVMEKTPPELIGDIHSDGIALTGGGSLLYGLDKKISERFNVKCRIADDPIECVAKGTGLSLNYIDSLIEGGYSFKSREDLASIAQQL